MKTSDGVTNATEVELVVNQSKNENDALGNVEDRNAKQKRKGRGRKKRAGSTSTEQMVEEELKKMSCTNGMGCKGFALLFAMLSVSVGEFVIFYVYANATTAGATNFERIGTPKIWIFLMLSILFFLRSAYTAIFWSKDARKKMIQLYLNITNAMRGNIIMKYVQKYYYKNLGINGRYYFWKLYAFEFIENWVQFSNLLSVYSCMLPFEAVLSFEGVLLIESLNRSIFMYKKIWKSRSHVIDIQERNFQVEQMFP